MHTVEISETVEIPEEVEASLEGRKVTIKGPKGTLIRDFSHAPVSIELQGKKIRVWAEWPRKKEAALVGTLQSHIRNMITGVQQGFKCKLKTVFSHFPISVKVQGKTILVENFTGERSPRRVRIMGSAQVMVQGDDIIVQGLNIEDVSQTAANIEQATKVKRKDPRVFLDGIYVYEKGKGTEQ
ncbi:50S ribosomal protein L6 [Candidatus Bathyarchaeota archaeon]|nr:50S ribosomal protein L6 [Candidatus Bathyarchaeota archaeon]